MFLIEFRLTLSDPQRLNRQSSPFLFSPNRSRAEASCFCLSNHRVRRVLSTSLACPIVAQPSALILCLFAPRHQNATDSSSNSSQKIESSLQPFESSPLPQRHKCMLGHRHDLHDPYRLPDHYFLDQVRPWQSYLEYGTHNRVISLCLIVTCLSVFCWLHQQRNTE